MRLIKEACWRSVTKPCALQLIEQFSSILCRYYSLKCIFHSSSALPYTLFSGKAVSCHGRGLELHGLQSPFQPELFCDFIISSIFIRPKIILLQHYLEVLQLHQRMYLTLCILKHYQEAISFHHFNFSQYNWYKNNRILTIQILQSEITIRIICLIILN